MHGLSERLAKGRDMGMPYSGNGRTADYGRSSSYCDTDEAISISILRTRPVSLTERLAETSADTEP